MSGALALCLFLSPRSIERSDHYIIWSPDFHAPTVVRRSSDVRDRRISIPGHSTFDRMAEAATGTTTHGASLDPWLPALRGELAAALVRPCATTGRVCCTKVTKKKAKYDDPDFLRFIDMAIQKHPNFIPNYTLKARYLIAKQHSKEEAMEVIAKSWRRFIAPENTLLSEHLFFEEFKDSNMSEALSILKSANSNEEKDLANLLLAVLYAAYGDYMHAKNTMLNVVDKHCNFYRLVAIYLKVKEAVPHGTMVDFSSLGDDILPINWWNRFLYFSAAIA